VSADPVVIPRTFTLTISEDELVALKTTAKVAATCIKHMPESDLKLAKATAALVVLGLVARVGVVGT